MKILLCYIVIVNILTFSAFGIDKWKAQHDRWRIKEATLLGMSLIGGCFGGYIGMKAFHHKTRKPKFRYGVPAMIVLWIVLGVFFVTTLL